MNKEARETVIDISLGLTIGFVMFGSPWAWLCVTVMCIVIFLVPGHVVTQGDTKEK